MRSTSPISPTPGELDLLLHRIKSEYREMPGMQLTGLQAARLLGIDPVICAVLLDRLIAAGYLRCHARGRYGLAEHR